MWYQRESDSLILHLYIQPGARKTEVSGLYGDALKIRLSAPPIDGRANEALIQFIAQVFRVPVRQVKLIKGEKSRHKTLMIKGNTCDPEFLYQKK